MDTPRSTSHHASDRIDLRSLGWIRCLSLFALMLLILGHNLIFPSLVLPWLSLDTLSHSFARVQLMRNLLELGCIGLCLQILGLPQRRYFHQAWRNLSALRTITAVLLLMSLSSFVLRELSSLFPLSAFAPGRVLESNSLSAILLNSVVLTPLREELFFRGLLWTLLNAWIGARPATFASALLFSAAHFPAFDPAAMLSLFIFGLLMGFVLPRYGLGVCIAAHMSLNAWAVFWQEPAAPLRSWLTQNPVVQISLSLSLLTLFFRGLFELIALFKKSP